jgi:cysteine desulfurase
MVKRALFAFLESAGLHGNAASLHSYGRDAAALIAEAEAAVLRTFRASPREWAVTFTGSGTEANQLAVRSALLPSSAGESEWAVSAIEHSCVLDLLPEMAKAGIRIQSLKPNAEGEVRSLLSFSEKTKLISLIGVGNETGIFQWGITSHILSTKTLPIKKRPSLHIDHAAGWGKAELDLSAAFAPDLVAIAGHKLGGLAGSGALIHRRSIPVVRPGTPNLAGIVGLKAIADSWPEFTAELLGLRSLRDRFERDLRERFPFVRIVGETLSRSPNVSNFYFPDLGKDLSLVAGLDLRGFAVSAGSACASQTPEPSHVLLAMGVPELDARNALRVSLHPGNTADELSGLLGALGAILKHHEIA